MTVMFANWFRLYVFACVFIYVTSKSISNTWINLKTNDISGVSSFNFIDSNDPSRRENYTVSFVPLISVIAHYLPTFLKRLQTQEIIAARSKRSNWPFAYQEVCMSHHLGRFPNNDSKCQFIECAMNFKNLISCSKSNTLGNTVDYSDKKRITDVIELKSKIDPNNRIDTSSFAVMYVLDKCVSVILHQCSPGHVYNNRLQTCLPQNDQQCPD